MRENAISGVAFAGTAAVGSNVDPAVLEALKKEAEETKASL